jgi:hypothetical protein
MADRMRKQGGGSNAAGNRPLSIDEMNTTHTGIMLQLDKGTKRQQMAVQTSNCWLYYSRVLAATIAQVKQTKLTEDNLSKMGSEKPSGGPKS